MRQPLTLRSTRRAALAVTAVLAVGLGLPAAPGIAAPARAACADPTSAAVGQDQPQDGNAVSAFIPPLPDSVAAGGAPVELGIEQGNLSDTPDQRLAPQFALFASAPGGGPGRLVNLSPADVTVQVMWHGAWRTLPVHRGCDPVLVADTSSVAEPVAAGQAHRYLFRLSLAAGTPSELRTIDVYGGPDGQGRTAQAVLGITRG